MVLESCRRHSQKQPFQTRICVGGKREKRPWARDSESGAKAPFCLNGGQAEGGASQCKAEGRIRRLSLPLDRLRHRSKQLGNRSAPAFAAILEPAPLTVG